MKISESLRSARNFLLKNGDIVSTTRWQGSTEHPSFLEILHPRLTMDMEGSEITLEYEVKSDNLDWAKEHFNERVSGIPFNPPPSHEKWRTKTNEYFSSDRQFSHTYPERYWYSHLVHQGYRFDNGDLNTLVELLKKEPDTRQAVLPMFIYEDMTAALQGERVPCSLSWNFIIRNNKMDCTYTLRSCDAVRHLHNDVYFTNRLVLWIIKKTGLDIEPGKMILNITSLHCFNIKSDILILERLTNV